MWIKNITLLGVGGVDELALSFDPKMNIICGPNGIGKTTILESVAHVFSVGATDVLKRNVRALRSRIDAVVEVNGVDQKHHMEFDEFLPNKQNNVTGLRHLSQKLLSLKTSRTFGYRPLNAVARDAERPDHVNIGAARNGVALNEVKNWFVNRYLYSAHNESLTPSQLSNFRLACRAFSALNCEFSFNRVDASTNEILVDSPTGEIYYEYLSSGFKSCLSIIFGIIKEVEFRFSSPRLDAADFDGIILIDEIELHLHPEWQARVLPVLAEMFPVAQFICTTHSPHVIQAAKAEQIIAIENLGSGARQRLLPASEFGFIGWTIEEVLTDVMGMDDLRTDAYRAALKSFESAMDVENFVKAKDAYRKLDLMLHPKSLMRKMLRLQLGSLPESVDD